MIKRKMNPVFEELFGIAFMDLMHAPVKCKEMWVNSEKVK